MRASEFLFWLLGAIQVASLKEIVKEDIKKIILDHIQLVLEFQEYRDENTIGPLDLIAQIKGLLTFGTVKENELNAIEVAIQSTLNDIKNKSQTSLAYYLQGGFEVFEECNLAINAHELKVSFELIKDLPNSDLKEKLCFFFMLTGDKPLNLDQIVRLQGNLDDIFEHVIKKNNKQQKPNPTPLVSTRLKPIIEPKYPGAIDIVDIDFINTDVVSDIVFKC